MRRTALVAVTMLAVACKLPPKPKAEGRKDAAAAKLAPISVDDRVLREARAAKSSFLENRTECPVLNSGLPATLALLDEAQKETKTQDAHDSIEAMKQEMRDAIDNCSP